MEENKKEELQEQAGNQEVQEEQKSSSNARFMLWTLAGIYLLYTGYSLCKGFVTGAEGTSVGFMLAGIVFAIIGVGLLAVSVKTMISQDKLKKAREAKDAAIASAAGGELKKENEPEAKKSMSISERANLTKRLEDEEESEEE